MAFRTWKLKNEKWETGPADIVPKPMTEGRRRTLEMVMDAIIMKAKDEIIVEGTWAYTEEVKVAEEAISEVYLDVLNGTGKVSSFQEACNRWRDAGMKRKKALNREPCRPASD